MRFLSSKIACILKWYLQRRLCWWRRSNLKIPKQFSLKVALELTKWANKNSRFLWNVKHCQLFGRGNYFVIFKSNKERKDKESQRTTGYTSNSRAWRDSGTRHVRNFFLSTQPIPKLEMIGYRVIKFHFDKSNKP